MTDTKNIKSEITKTLDVIGTDKHESTAVPHSKNNRDSLAHELHVAQTIKSYGEGRYNKAKKACVDAGMMGDPEVLVPGATETAFAGQCYVITRSINNPTVKIDSDKLIVALRKLGVSADKIEKAKAEATVTSKPPERFTVAPK
jgi:hypothetical protein